MITINLGKAKEIAKDKIRKKRAPLLLKTDDAFNRAFEKAVKKSFEKTSDKTFDPATVQSADFDQIMAEKKRLRDLTSGVDQCTDTASLTQLINWDSN